MSDDKFLVFVENFKEVLEELDISVKKVITGHENILKPKKAVAVSVGLTGNIKGKVLIYMTEKVAIKIASIMNFEDLNQLDDLVIETISELANMTIARGVMQLNNMGVNVDLSPPSVFYGENLKFFSMDNSINHLATFNTSCGFIFVIISLNK